MSVKEYLVKNSTPFLDNYKNVLMLEVLESNAFSTPNEMAEYTRIPLNEVNEILQILYNNSLVSFNKERYKITNNGINVLNRMGLSDIQIINLLENTQFKAEEYNIYKSLFEVCRKDFLDYYLVFAKVLGKIWQMECEDIIKKFCADIDDAAMKKESYSFIIAILIHDFAQILYTDETSKLMNYYTKLYNYSMNNSCISTKVYHSSKRKKQIDKDERDVAVERAKEILEKTMYQKQVTFENYDTNWNNWIRSKKYNINNDFKLSNSILHNDDLVNKIFLNNDIEQLAKALNISKIQTRFVLKNIKSKVDSLLREDKDVSY